MKEFKVGDRVVFINDNYIWFGIEFTIIDIVEGIAVHVVDDQGGFHSFNRDNLRIVNVDTLQRIQTFTKKHKNFEIIFEDGKIIMRDWCESLSDHKNYRCNTIEQLEALMGAWEIVKKFEVENGNVI